MDNRRNYNNNYSNAPSYIPKNQRPTYDNQGVEIVTNYSGGGGYSNSNTNYSSNYNQYDQPQQQTGFDNYNYYQNQNKPSNNSYKGKKSNYQQDNYKQSGY